MTNWIVQIDDSSDGGWHIQARTADQLCSFATTVSKNCGTMHRGKTANKKADVFMIQGDRGHVTMNVVGKIDFRDKRSPSPASSKAETKP